MHGCCQVEIIDEKTIGQGEDIEDSSNEAVEAEAESAEEPVPIGVIINETSEAGEEVEKEKVGDLVE